MMELYNKNGMMLKKLTKLIAYSKYYFFFISIFIITQGITNMLTHILNKLYKIMYAINIKKKEIKNLIFSFILTTSIIIKPIKKNNYREKDF